MKANEFKVRRLVTFGSLLIVAPLGFVSKYYNGPGAWWFNNYLGGVMYEVFWCLAAYLLWPRASALSIAVWVFASTCSLEFLQLWHPHFLQVIRETFIGRTLMGTSFTWWDFPYYIAGCLAGWLLIGRLSQISPKEPSRN